MLYYLHPKIARQIVLLFREYRVHRNAPSRPRGMHWREEGDCHIFKMQKMTIFTVKNTSQ